MAADTEESVIGFDDSMYTDRYMDSVCNGCYFDLFFFFVSNAGTYCKSVYFQNEQSNIAWDRLELQHFTVHNRNEFKCNSSVHHSKRINV